MEELLQVLIVDLFFSHLSISCSFENPQTEVHSFGLSGEIFPDEYRHECHLIFILLGKLRDKRSKTSIKGRLYFLQTYPIIKRISLENLVKQF